MSGDPFWRAISAQGLDVPGVVLALHAGEGYKHYAGHCDIAQGSGVLARLALWLAGFPPAGKGVATRLTIRTEGQESIWERDFGGHITRSRLSFDAAACRVIERFGPIRLALTLTAHEGQLHIAVTSMRLFELPVPKPLLPVSATTESEGCDGRFRFNVEASAPLAGFLIRYTGELQTFRQ